MRLGEEAAQRGFDWKDIEGPLAKLREEVEELEAAIAEEESPERIAEELGDILFSLVNVARHLGCEPERALEGTNEKFRRRLKEVFRRVEASGSRPEEVELDELEALWQETKKEERKRQ